MLTISIFFVKVGIHIADVSYYVTRDSPMDQEAKKRATTIYLTDKNIPMLPRQLCENLCSLVPAVDRLTFSVMAEIDAEGNIVSPPWFGRTVIHSAAQLAYETAQMFIDGSSELPMPKVVAPHTIDELKETIVTLNNISKFLRARRKDAGSLLLNNLRIYFKLDPVTHEPLSIGQYILKEANNLIEEFMLMANRAVAERILASYPDGSLLRIHPYPQDRKFVQFLHWCRKQNIEVRDDSSVTLQQTLDAYNDDFVALCAVRSKATMSMILAKYVATDRQTETYHHYGLGEGSEKERGREREIRANFVSGRYSPFPHHLPSVHTLPFLTGFDFYTHFTSPIRRYADLMVHRLLQAALSNDPPPYTHEEVDVIAKHCNTRKERADHAQDDCDGVGCACVSGVCEWCVCLSESKTIFLLSLFQHLTFFYLSRSSSVAISMLSPSRKGSSMRSFPISSDRVRRLSFLHSPLRAVSISLDSKSPIVRTMMTMKERRWSKRNLAIMSHYLRMESRWISEFSTSSKWRSSLQMTKCSSLPI